MATGHILPGYGHPVSRLRKAHSAYPADRNKLKEIAVNNVPPLKQQTLDEIRAKARQTWACKDREKTTYGYFYSGQDLDEPTHMRPTSPTRRHKPHPKPVFLTNRLHYIEGYHNPDATMGKEVYRVDDSLSSEKKQLRQKIKDKYIGRPMTSAINQYHEPYVSLKESTTPVEAWGAKAWLDIADDDHKHEVMNAVTDYREKELFNISMLRPPPHSPRPHTAIPVPSIHRWLRHAGARELTNLQGSYQVYPPSSIQPLGNTIGTTYIRRQQELDQVKKFRYSHKPSRGEFLIHPEWPPTFIHHKLD